MTKVKIWGREHELAFLADQLAKTKSATLLHGEPQIGKTAVADEMRAELSEAAGRPYRFGYHKAVATTYDPFTYAVAGLLAEIYTFENTADQFPIIGAMLRQKFTLSKFKELCYVIWGAIAGTPGLKAVEKLVGWFKTEAEGLDLSIKPTALSAHEVEHLLRAVSEACPNIRMVLIVDDYSASLELRGSHSGPTWDNGTLLHLLKSSIPNLHIILTWKETADTYDALIQLKHLFLQYSGTILRLSELSRADVRVWIREELPGLIEVLGEAPLLQLVDGLPKVAAELKAAAILDPQAAVTMARQIKLGSYDFLHSYLRRCDTLQRDLLLQLAVVALPVRADELAWLMKSDEEDVIHHLKLAVDANILRQAANNVFVFQHDIKRAVMLDHLARFHSPSHYYQRALRHYEKQIESSDSFSWLRILFAFHTAQALARFAPQNRRLEVVYDQYLQLYSDHSRVEYQTLLKQLVHDPVFAQRPAPLRVSAYRRAVGVVIEDVARGASGAWTDELLQIEWGDDMQRAAQDILTILETLVPSDEHAVETINALKFIVAFLKPDSHANEITGVLLFLQKWTNQANNLPKIANELAATVVNLLFALRHPVDVSKAVELIETLMVLHPGHSDIETSYTQALVNSLKRTDRVQWIETVVSKLAVVAERANSAPSVEEAFMRGMHDAAVSLDAVGHRSGIKSIVTRAAAYADTRTSHKEMTRWYAELLSGATAYFGREEQIASAVEAYAMLHGVRRKNPADLLIATAVASAARNVVTLAVNNRDRRLIEDTFTALQELAREHQSNQEIATDYCYALCDVAFFHLSEAETERAQDAIGRLNALRLVEGNLELATCWANCLAHAAVPVIADEAEHVRHTDTRLGSLIRDSITSLAHTHRQSATIAVSAAMGLANLLGWPSLANDSEWTNSVHTQLRAFVAEFKDNDKIAAHYGRGLFLSWFAAREMGVGSPGAYEAMAKVVGGQALKTFEMFQEKVVRAIESGADMNVKRPE